MAATELKASLEDLRRGRMELAKDRVMVKITPSIKTENISTEPFCIL